jgi:hypothetical protein
MKLTILILLIFISCSGVKKVEVIESPSVAKLNLDGTIKKNDGRENAKRMKYYNTLQHKSFYRHKRL